MADRRSPSSPTDRVWQEAALARLFLEQVRGGLPLAAEQLDVLLRVVRAAGLPPRRVLDLGCGDAILARAVLGAFPQSSAVLVDFSPEMLAAAREAAAPLGTRCEFVAADFGSSAWLSAVQPSAPFELIVSGLAIHHQSDTRKRELYGELLGLLVPGGLLLNLEHVASGSLWASHAFSELMIDSLWEFHRQRGSASSRDAVARDYVNRPDKAANILAGVETQCAWLRELRYADVECYFKLFELALFGGRRPFA